MKICRKSMAGVVITGVTLGAAIFAASALQAQIPAPPPAASAEPSIQFSHRAKEFLQDAAQANQTEIIMADVAQEKSQNAAVRELAQTVRTDQQLNYVQLQSIARAHGVALDASLSGMNQRTVNRLQKASDADFDKEYTKAMIKDHVACIKNFDKAAAQVEDPDVKPYAANSLPTLRGHLLRAEEAARSVGVDEATISSILKGLPTDEVERGVTFNQN